MHAGLVGIADVGGTQIGIRDKAIDECRLTHARIATEQRNLTLQLRAQRLYPIACLGTDGVALVAYGPIEVHHHLLIMAFLVTQHIALIKYKYYGHAIGLSRSQEAVNEGGAGLWFDNGDDQQGLVDISREDMALLGEVDAFADDVVLAVGNLRDPAFFIHSDPVANSNGVSGADSLDTEIALHLTIKELAIVRQNGVPASGILNNKTFQLIDN